MLNSKGTIVYVGGFEMPDKNAAAHRVMGIAKILKELGYNVCFCGIDRQVSNNDHSYDIGPFVSRPAKYPAGSIELIRYTFSFTHIQKVIEACVNVKFVIAYNMHSIQLKKLQTYCFKNGIKVIGDLTEWYENNLSINPIKLMRCIDTLYVMRHLQKKFDAAIVISSYLYQYYKAFIKRIVVIPPLVDITDQKWCSQHATTSNQVEFVYAGTTDLSKDRLDKIICAFAKVSITHLGYHLSVAGLTREQFCAAYSGGIEYLDIVGNRVSFLGRISHSESVKLLQAADYCIFVRESSRKNNAGFPTKFVECVTTGIGIVTNGISDITNYFPQDGKSILLASSSISDICSAIELVLDMDLTSNRSKRCISQVFNFANYTQKISALLDTLT